MERRETSVPGETDSVMGAVEDIVGAEAFKTLCRNIRTDCYGFIAMTVGELMELTKACEAETL